MITDAEITSEQDDAALGHLALWAEVLKSAVEDVSGGIRIGALTADLRPTTKEFKGDRHHRAMDAMEAARFLKSSGGIRLCDMFRIVPEWVFRRCRERAGERPAKANIRPVKPGPSRGRSTPKYDMTGKYVKTWTAIRPTGESTSEGSLWLCLCSECGVEREFPGKRLKDGRVGGCVCQSRAAKAAAARKSSGVEAVCLHCGAPLDQAPRYACKMYCGVICKAGAQTQRRRAAKAALASAAAGN